MCKWKKDKSVGDGMLLHRQLSRCWSLLFVMVYVAWVLGGCAAGILGQNVQGKELFWLGAFWGRVLSCHLFRFSLWYQEPLNRSFQSWQEEPFHTLSGLSLSFITATKKHHLLWVMQSLGKQMLWLIFPPLNQAVLWWGIAVVLQESLLIEPRRGVAPGDTSLHADN